MAKLQNNCDLVSTTPTGSAVGSSQGLVLVQKYTGGPTTAVAFTGLSQYPYTNYKLIISNFSSNSSLSAQLTVSTNNGAAYLSSGYQSANSLLTYNGGSFQNANTNTSYFSLSINLGNGSNATFNMDIDLLNMNSSTRLICCVGNSTFYDGTNTYYGIITGNYTSVINANAIQIVPGSGNFTANFYLYGYNQ